MKSIFFSIQNLALNIFGIKMIECIMLIFFILLNKIYEFLTTVKNLIKKLNRENFTCQVKALHIDGWNIEDGVKVSTLNSILKKNNISYYPFDITNKCFDKTDFNYVLCIHFINQV